jgi:hypothetical protein
MRRGSTEKWSGRPWMEYLVVIFEARRRVFVNGNPSGFTNSVVQLDAGTHTITMEPPPNFSPISQTIVLQATSPLDPMTVTFHRLPASAIPPAVGTPA